MNFRSDLCSLLPSSNCSITNMNNLNYYDSCSICHYYAADMQCYDIMQNLLTRFLWRVRSTPESWNSNQTYETDWNKVLYLLCTFHIWDHHKCTS